MFGEKSLVTLEDTAFHHLIQTRLESLKIRDLMAFPGTK